MYYHHYSDKDITKLLKKINELETKNKLLQNDLKLEKISEGAMVYVRVKILIFNIIIIIIIIILNDRVY